jgi:tRNA threonylcarbamoyl adenosine modification protein YeaZ
MKILAFDTSLGAVSVAVRWCGTDGKWSLCEVRQARQRGHADGLMPLIGKVMSQAGLAFCDLDRVAVTVGPGNFTGVRVGVAAARALVLASGASAIGVGTLVVMAHQSNEQLAGRRWGRLLAVAVDARQDSVYLQLFAHGHQAAGPPQLLAVSAAAQQIGTAPAIIVGSGAVPVRCALRAGGSAEAALPDLLPSAASLALLASELAPTATLRPLYLRPPDAKPRADLGLLPVPP